MKKISLTLLLLASCAPGPNPCEQELLDCRAEYVRERPFSSYTLFKHCSQAYGECLGDFKLDCLEECELAYHPKKNCIPACVSSGGEWNGWRK